MQANLNTALTMSQTANLIAVTGDENTVLVEGHMGSGKSSILKLLADKLPTHKAVYIDCTQLDVGDIAIPAVNHETRTSTFYPNSRFGTHTPQPVCIMLDEIGKASRPVQNALLPVMLERRVGENPLPAGSIVFCTTNLGGEGVGDTLQAHARNRIDVVEMRKPTADEWSAWASGAGVDPAVLQWVEETPMVFADFREVEDARNNPYIFHPKDPSRRSFVTPRSLHRAGTVIAKRDLLDNAQLYSAVAGLIGARGAADLSAYVQLADKLPKWAAIVSNPTKALLPEDNPAAMGIIVQKIVQGVQRETLTPALEYVERLPRELQALFASKVLSPAIGKSGFALTNRKFSEWANKNGWMFR